MFQMHTMEELLCQSAALHNGRLCPRQVLGVRMGMLAGRVLGLDLPQRDKRLFVFMEMDGCGADGVSVATGCRVGHRTMRMIDFGKLAATFVDTRTQEAIRIHPHPAARACALALLPQARSRWHCQLEAYQLMPDHDLLIAEPVVLQVDLEAIISRAGQRTLCQSCGEEIANQREINIGGAVFCRACAGESYCQVAAPWATQEGMAAARFMPQAA